MYNKFTSRKGVVSMRIIRNVVSLFFICVILLCCAFVVGAEETQIDWSNVDLESFNYQELDAQQWSSLGDWLQKDADLHTVFYVTTTKGDGWIGEMWSSIVYSLFMEDPVPFIQALALEDEAAQNKTISRITFEAVIYKEEFEQMMRGLVLPDAATDSERNILTNIISHAEEDGFINITNPKTGDPIGVAVLLMAVSGLGLAALLILRKRPS